MEENIESFLGKHTQEIQAVLELVESGQADILNQTIAQTICLRKCPIINPEGEQTLKVTDLEFY